MCSAFQTHSHSLGSYGEDVQIRDTNSRILLTDSYETIAKRSRGAVTNSISGISFDPVERPGTSNLTVLSMKRQ